MMQLYTIGHSAHPVAELVRLLQAHDIKTLVDVRSTPASRFHPQFNKSRLEGYLRAYGIRYVFLGQALGGRPKDPTCYPGGTRAAGPGGILPRPDYAEIMKRDSFVAGIEQLLALAGEQAMAMLCSEEDPSLCHRHHLIAAFLRREHPEVEVLHIRKDGSLTKAATLAMGEETAPGQPPLL